jgi:hypothetical protein
MTTTGNISPATNQPNLYPITAIVGTSVNYGLLVNETFTLFQQMIGTRFNRSNATVAMTDTLPNPATDIGHLGKLPNGWNIMIANIDASASITLTPTLPATINGTTSLTITAGHTSTIYTDGVNFFSSTSPN